MIKNYQYFTESIDNELDVFIPENPHINKTPEEIEREYYLELGKKGELVKYLEDHGKKFTFGILKVLFDDALQYKRNRALKKGFFKMLTRAVPMALSFFFLPISLLAWGMGFSRAIDKVVVPVLKDPGNDYNAFLKRIILGSIRLLEGDYKMFMEKDWFYDIMGVSYHIKNLLKEEHIIKFAHYLAHKIEKEDPDKELPPKYVEGELKKWIKENFEVDIK